MAKWYRILRRILRAKSLHFGFCNICGRNTVFVCTDAFTLTDKKQRNDLACILCNGKARNRALVAALLDLLKCKSRSLYGFCNSSSSNSIKILNASSAGALHQYLSNLPNYVCSEYLPEVPTGTSLNGVRCENLESLSFPDGTFDLVITEDVLEHVRHPNNAFSEINRVLRSGGATIFTVPIYGDKTVERVDTTGEEDIYLFPPLYHGDPLRSEGALAYNDFGSDIVDLVVAHGFSAKLLEFNVEDRRFLCGDVILSKKEMLAC